MRILLDCPVLGFWLNAQNPLVELELPNSTALMVFKLGPNFMSKGSARMILYLNDQPFVWFALEDFNAKPPEGCIVCRLEVDATFKASSYEALPANVQLEGKVTQVSSTDMQVYIRIKA